jgi:acyl dehydratase
MWFLEDMPIGRRLALGGAEVTAEAIVRFAEKFDPQPFHLDEAAGKASHFGGLVASGWHTCALFMRAYVEHNRRVTAEMAARGDPVAEPGPSPGVEDLRFLQPVRPGDRLSFFMTPAEARPLRSRPGWGIVTYASEVVNQRGDIVLAFRAKVLVERRMRG